ncbi:MAG: BON domain-containing protein [Pseudomonadota bacterium]
MKIVMTRAWPALVAALLTGCGPAVLVGGTTVVARSVVQERSTMDALSDTEIALSIGNRLGAHSGELYRDVGVDVVEKRVLLTGSVPERQDRVDAEAIAWTGPGVVAVTNEITVAEDSGVGAYWRDVRIANGVRYRLLTDLDVASQNYNVETVDGVVHLTGLARSSGELDTVIAHARGVDGVARVVSHVLLIDDPRRQAPAAQAAVAVPETEAEAEAAARARAPI